VEAWQSGQRLHLRQGRLQVVPACYGGSSCRCGGPAEQTTLRLAAVVLNTLGDLVDSRRLAATCIDWLSRVQLLHAHTAHGTVMLCLPACYVTF
jgi:hypothetical protein